jgi:septal ring factor EnvC (AmiA/AmiB activator)
MIEEDKEESVNQPTPDTFFDALVNSGFFPESLEFVKDKLNPGNTEEETDKSPDITETQQESNIAIEDIKPIEEPKETETEKETISLSDLKIETSDTNNESNVATQELEQQSEEQEKNEQELKSEPVSEPESSESSDKINESLKDLIQKSKANQAQSFANEEPQEPNEEPEDIKGIDITNESSTTNVMPLEPDHFKIVKDKYKQIPNWRTLIG